MVSYAAHRGRYKGASGWAVCQPPRLSHTAGASSFPGGAPTTVKATLREALLPAVKKSFGSLSCCPTWDKPLASFVSGSDSSWHRCEHPPGQDEVLCPSSHARQHVRGSQGNEWHGASCICGKSQGEFPSDFFISNASTNT